AVEDRFTFPVDGDADTEIGPDCHPGLQPDTRPNGTRSFVNFGLWQIQRIFALDVARTHVVPDGEADHLHPRIDDDDQFRLRDRPLRVVTNADGIAVAHRVPAKTLHENLRAGRIVHTSINVAVVRFAFAGFLAALVGDARRPDFLFADGR